MRHLYPEKQGWSRRPLRDRFEPWFELGVVVLWIGLILFATTWRGQ